MADATPPRKLRFTDLLVSIEVSFWEELRNRKLTDWKLAEPQDSVAAVLRANVSDQTILTPPNLVCVSGASLSTSATTAVSSGTTDFVVAVPIPGRVKNFNLISSLDNLDLKDTLVSDLTQQLLVPLFAGNHADASVEEEENAWSCAPFALFVLYTYVDAKNYRFHHREAFPSLSFGASFTICRSELGGQGLLEKLTETTVAMLHEHACALLREHPERGCNPFLCAIEKKDAHVRFYPLSPRTLSEIMGDSTVVPVLGLFDFSDTVDALSLPARNIVNCLQVAVPDLTSLVVFGARPGGPSKSIAVELSCGTGSALSSEKLRAALAESDGDAAKFAQLLPSMKVSGWRSKKVESIDLGAAIDPVRRADADSRFNLELMKWRVLPQLELAGLADCKALLLGAGTLGCNVARNLLMWGVRHITLVDRGQVSFSNLARQSLFTFEDAQQRRNKADAAAAALRSILPSTNATAITMTIHMPGHRIDPDREEVLAEIRQLDHLIQSHDVVFLLTDSREARWMPTILAAAHGVPVVNTALGFDTWVVMRHGILTLPSPSSAVPAAVLPSDPAQLGCYFCSDVVVPTDSLSARALDEQCTVTRPAVSSIASAVAVEMLAAAYQHPLGFACGASSGEGDGVCRLGLLPQQIRGNVFAHTMSQLRGDRNPSCTACAAPMLEAYREGKEYFLLRCVNEPSLIEEVCGIKKMKESWGADADNMDWYSSEDDS